MLHTFSLCLLITAVYQVPTDNILIRSLIQWDFFPIGFVPYCCRFFFFFIIPLTHIRVYLKLESLSLPLLKCVQPDFFSVAYMRVVIVHARGKKTLSAVVSNCVNPFKKDVFQFPGLLLPPPIGPLPVHPPASLQHVLALNILFLNNKYPKNTYTREKIGGISPRPLLDRSPVSFSKLSE